MFIHRRENHNTKMVNCWVNSGDIVRRVAAMSSLNTDALASVDAESSPGDGFK